MKFYPVVHIFGAVAAGIAAVIMTFLTTSVVTHAASPPIPCVATPCQFATNIAWTTSGTKDTRPGTWGNTDVVQSQIPFANVPAGYVVSITHVSGDEIAAPNGTALPNSMAYGLIGLTNSTPFQSPYVGPGLGSSGVFIYKQVAIPASGARIPINENVLGTLNADNILIIKQALFLDTEGVPIHFEATITLDFVYLAAPVGVAKKAPGVKPRLRVERP
jgi:hypothetical protein